MERCAVFLTVRFRIILIIVSLLTIVSGIVTTVSLSSRLTLGYGKVIVIDAGHGGEDGGVVGSAGVKESEINLAIAKKIKTCL